MDLGRERAAVIIDQQNADLLVGILIIEVFSVFATARLVVGKRLDVNDLLVVSFVLAWDDVQMLNALFEFSGKELRGFDLDFELSGHRSLREQTDKHYR